MDRVDRTEARRRLLQLWDAMGDPKETAEPGAGSDDLIRLHEGQITMSEYVERRVQACLSKIAPLVDKDDLAYIADLCRRYVNETVRDSGRFSPLWKFLQEEDS